MIDNGNPLDDPEAALKPINESLVRLLAENQKVFLGFLRKRLPSSDIAEDLLQQGLLKAIKHGNGLKDKESVISWFYTILRNMTTDFYRSRAAEDRKNDSFQAKSTEWVQDPAPDLDEKLHKEICACMNGLIPVLKPGYSELIRRIDLEGEEPATVAEGLGITYNNLMVRMHRARQALRVSLERTCGVCARHGCLDCTCESMAGSSKQ